MKHSIRFVFVRAFTTCIRLLPREQIKKKKKKKKKKKAGRTTPNDGKRLARNDGRKSSTRSSGSAADSKRLRIAGNTMRVARRRPHRAASEATNGSALRWSPAPLKKARKRRERRSTASSCTTVGGSSSRYLPGSEAW